MQGAESAADCLYSSGCYPSVPNGLCEKVLPFTLGTEDLDEMSPHPGVLPSSLTSTI
jgi:hypothetical protein